VTLTPFVEGKLLTKDIFWCIIIKVIFDLVKSFLFNYKFRHRISPAIADQCQAVAVGRRRQLAVWLHRALGAPKRARLEVLLKIDIKTLNQ